MLSSSTNTGATVRHVAVHMALLPYLSQRGQTVFQPFRRIQQFYHLLGKDEAERGGSSQDRDEFFRLGSPPRP